MFSPVMFLGMDLAVKYNHAPGILDTNQRLRNEFLTVASEQDIQTYTRLPAQFESVLVD